MKYIEDDWNIRVILIAIDALKKQIPLMPVQNFYLEGDYLEGDYLLECPICKNILGEGQIYCTDCGQRLNINYA